MRKKYKISFAVIKKQRQPLFQRRQKRNFSSNKIIEHDLFYFLSAEDCTLHLWVSIKEAGMIRKLSCHSN